MESSVCKKICELEAAGVPFAIATIIDSQGSTPRKAGSTMLVLADGQQWGSIGGGKGEGEIIQLAIAAIETGRSFCHAINMSHAVAADEGMVCGGNMEVFIHVRR